MSIILNEHLAKRFHVSVRLFSDRSQMTSKCSKTMKWHTSCRRVCHWCLSHFDVFCDLLLNKPTATATWNLFVLYNDQKSTKTDKHTRIVPLYCSRICASLGMFLIPNATFRLGLFFPFFILLVYSSWKSLSVFTCAKQNNGENILQSRKCVSFCRSDDLWWQLLWRFLAV